MHRPRVRTWQIVLAVAVVMVIVAVFLLAGCDSGSSGTGPVV